MSFHLTARAGSRLAGAELFQVVRGGHAADVEEVFVLTQAAGAGVGASPFGAMQ
jgi:hypothetical protein